MVEQPTQQLQQQNFEQAISQQALATAHPLGLAKQQGQGVLQAADLRQGQHDQGRQ
jgi:hypothetical protein